MSPSLIISRSTAMKPVILSVFLLLGRLSWAACPYSGQSGSLHPRAAENSGENPLGDGGFLDQFIVDDSNSFTTTDFGTPVDDRISLKAGHRGPTLLEDFVFRTKITRFDHERIPERAVHARGAAAHGYFVSAKDWSKSTAASFLGEKGKKTPVFVRFSTVAGSRGSADTARDVHGFAVRFYTDAGNYDIVGNNIPVFFLQDAIQFADLIHAVKPQPNNEIPQAATAHDTAWDFFSQNPSTLHTLLWAMSPHGIPRSYRHMNGFGVHTFRFVNKEGISKLIKWRFRSKQGLASLVWPEAQVLSGMNADFHRQDLFDAIESGQYPEWDVEAQIINEADVVAFGFDLLDPTKFLPEEKVPFTTLGKIVLNRNPINYFAETEQLMLCPGNVVRGVDFTDDPLLQGRLFSYVDTQINRNGGPNFEQIPINRPHPPAAVHNNNRDGAGQAFLHKNIFAYTQNSLNHGFPKPATKDEGNGFFTSPYRRITDARYVREISPTFNDHWSQPALFWNSLLPAEQQQVVNAIRFELSHITYPHIRVNTVTQLNLISHDLASRVAVAIGVPVPDANSTYYNNNKTNISVFSHPLPTIKTLRIAILANTDSQKSLSQAHSLSASFKTLGAIPFVLGQVPKTGVDLTYNTANAVLFDGIIATDGTRSLFGSISTYYPTGTPEHLVLDGYDYGKPVAVIGDSKSVFGSKIKPGKPGVYFVATEKDFPKLVRDFETGLKKFKFLDRFPTDS